MISVFLHPKQCSTVEPLQSVSFFFRVDIPAMYNNLDASLDTTAFTQYTQSQEESMYDSVFFGCITVSFAKPEV